ncbi:MAG: ROK family protein [Clostridia bacterium]|nr:ROK family protein [Clostridia bacterium]
MYALGFDIGGTKCAVILGRGEMPENHGDLIIDKTAFPTRVERGWQAIIDEMIASADALLSRNGITDPKNELVGIGISCGGPLDSKKGTINCPPNLPDWDNVPICDIFREHFGLRPNLQNDANACAVAEWKFGSGKGTDNMVFLTFGTGMGAGLILDGKLYSGTNDMAGEVGHIRLADKGPEGYGKEGSFEGFCSGGGIKRLGEMMLREARAEGTESVLFSEKEISAKTIALAARNGDNLSKKIYNICAEKLGMGLSILIDILNPEAIVIGSIYSRSSDLFDGIINNVINKEALSHSGQVCRILPAALGDSIGDFAALGLAF